MRRHFHFLSASAFTSLTAFYMASEFIFCRTCSIFTSLICVSSSFLTAVTYLLSSFLCCSMRSLVSAFILYTSSLSTSTMSFTVELVSLRSFDCPLT